MRIESRKIYRCLMQSVVCIILTCILSCNPNYKRVSFSGYVLDSETSKPIQNAELELTYWRYDTEIWESIGIEKNVKTNEKGYFHVELVELEAISLAVSAKGYYRQEKGYRINGSVIEDTFLVKKLNSNLVVL